MIVYEVFLRYTTEVDIDTTEDQISLGLYTTIESAKQNGPQKIKGLSELTAWKEYDIPTSSIMFIAEIDHFVMDTDYRQVEYERDICLTIEWREVQS